MGLAAYAQTGIIMMVLHVKIVPTMLLNVVVRPHLPNAKLDIPWQLQIIVKLVTISVKDVLNVPKLVPPLVTLATL